MGGIGPVGVGLSVTLSLFVMVVVMELYFVWRSKQRGRTIRGPPASSSTIVIPSEKSTASAVCISLAKSSLEWASQRTRDTTDWMKTGLHCLPPPASVDGDSFHGGSHSQKWGSSCLSLVKRTTDYASQKAMHGKEWMVMLSSRFSCLSKEEVPDAADGDGVRAPAENCGAACVAMAARGSAKWTRQLTRETKDSVKMLSSQLSCVSTNVSPLRQEECITIHGMTAPAPLPQTGEEERRWLAMARRNGIWIVQRTKEMKDRMKILMLRKRGAGAETAMEKAGGSSKGEEGEEEGEKKEGGGEAGGENEEEGEEEEDDIFKMVGLWGQPRFLFTIAEETKEEMEQEEETKSRGGKGSRKGSRGASSELLFVPSCCSSPSPYATPPSTPPFATPSASPGHHIQYITKLNHHHQHHHQQQQQQVYSMSVNMDMEAIAMASIGSMQQKLNNEKDGDASTVCIPAASSSTMDMAMAMAIDVGMVTTTNTVSTLSSSSSIAVPSPAIDVPSSSPNNNISSCPLTEDSSSSLSSSFSSATPGTVSPTATTNLQRASVSPSPKNQQQQKNPLTLLFDNPISSSSSSSPASSSCHHSHSRVYPLSLPPSHGYGNKDINPNHGNYICCSNEKLPEAPFETVEKPSFKIPAFSQPTTPSPFLRHVLLRQKQYNRQQVMNAGNS